MSDKLDLQNEFDRQGEPFDEGRSEPLATIRAQLTASEARYQELLKKWGEGYTAQVEARIKELEVELEECKHQNGISARERRLEARVTALSEVLKRIAKPALGGKLQQQIAQEALATPTAAQEERP